MCTIRLLLLIRFIVFRNTFTVQNFGQKRNKFLYDLTSMFCFDGPLTLLLYKPKPSKMVYMLSSCNEGIVIHKSYNW